MAQHSITQGHAIYDTNLISKNTYLGSYLV